MRVKDNTVKISDLHPGIVLALVIAEGIYKDAGADELVITSAKDGKHMHRSKHYHGKAVDLRIWNLPGNDALEVRGEIAAAVGNEYDVVLESDHIHLELDPE